MDRLNHSLMVAAPMQVDGVHLANGASASDEGEHAPATAASAPHSRTAELTISFEGEVYVFPAVTPEKLQAVLLLLGRQDTPNSTSNSDLLLQQNFQQITGINDPSQSSKLSRRFASLVRFREKRKERCFEKKIRYTCRKEVAQRMHRKNGQFASLKEDYKSPAENSDSSNATPPCPESIGRRCQHCGTSEKSTPAMRRGPAGPRSLCNACGLMGQISGLLQQSITETRSFCPPEPDMGTLRDLSKAAKIPYEQNEQDTSAEIKLSTTEPENSSAGQSEGSPGETKSVPMDSKQSPEKKNEKDIFRTAETVTDNLSIQLENHSLSLDEKDIEDLADASRTEFEIPAGFDDQDLLAVI